MSNNTEQQKQLFEVIELALEQNQEERSSWLKEHCPKEIFDAAAQLLYAAEKATLGHVDIGLSLPDDNYRQFLGTRIGVYSITELIGEGGMGYVFLAERDDGEFEQEVAIKLLRLSLSSPSLMKRFSTERQILSNLKHPNIATLYDGGTTDTGIPYLVMERVNGITIDQYIQQEQPTLEQIIALFINICSAVHAAHQALVIHRDIKPANILVDEHGQAKLLDFGIARSLDPVINEQTEKTKFVRLTPSYASPEQIRDDTLTTATDVYSLGVVLFEALTGELPYQITGLSPLQAEKLITSSLPQRPSISATENLSSHNNLKRRELDAIVLKALSKEVDRRYLSAGALQEDLQRFLDGKPVEAQLDTPFYRLRKLVSRHKGVAIASAIALIALVGGLSVSLVQMQNAKQQLARAEAVGSYLRNILLSPQPTADNPMQLGSEAKVSDLLLAAERALENDLEDQPLVKVELYNTISTAQMWMGNLDSAMRMTREAVALATGSDSVGDVEMVDALHVLGTVLDDAGHGDAAVSAYQEAIEIANKLGEEAKFANILAHNDLAVAYANENHWVKALDTQALTVSMIDDEIAQNPAYVSALLGNLGYFHYQLGDFKEAEKTLGEAISVAKEHAEAKYYHLRTRQRLARLLEAKGQLEDALTAYQDNIELADILNIDAEQEVVTAQLRIALIELELGNTTQGAATINAIRSEFEEYLDIPEAWIFHHADAALQQTRQRYQQALTAAIKAHQLSIQDHQADSERIYIDLQIARAHNSLGEYQSANSRIETAYQNTLAWNGEDSFLSQQIRQLKSELINHRQLINDMAN